MRAGRALTAAAAGLGLWLLGQGLYIPAKAVAAQLLLERAWTRGLASGEAIRPWPWADTRTVGRLTVPRLGVSRIVLAGVSGQALAFGPGELPQPHSTRPASSQTDPAGNTVLAGHRDTHFRFLRDLRTGDRFRLQRPTGRVRSYDVVETLVVDASETWVLDPREEPLLTLVTCYPFDALDPGGPLRYVVRARLSRAG